MVCSSAVDPAGGLRDDHRVRVRGLARRQGASALSPGRVRAATWRISRATVAGSAVSRLRIWRSPVSSVRLAATGRGFGAASARWRPASMARVGAATARWRPTAMARVSAAGAWWLNQRSFDPARARTIDLLTTVECPGLRLAPAQGRSARGYRFVRSTLALLGRWSAPERGGPGAHPLRGGRAWLSWQA